MFYKRQIVILGNTASLFLLVSYILCVGFCLLFPAYQMHAAWAPLLPGFEWLTPSGFLFGLLGSYGYGWFIAIIWVPLHDYFESRSLSKE